MPFDMFHPFYCWYYFNELFFADLLLEHWILGEEEINYNSTTCGKDACWWHSCAVPLWSSPHVGVPWDSASSLWCFQDGTNSAGKSCYL